MVIGMGQTNNDPLGRWTRSREVGDDGCMLVRPDRVVAWRSSAMVDDPERALADVLDRILGRES
jgi:2,4-dichlorophenol 6-monooxygenase